MNVDRERQVHPAEQCQGVRRELQPELVACKEAYQELCDSALCVQLLEEGLCESQVGEGLQDHAFQRNPIGGKLRLVHQPSHPIAVVICPVS